MLEYFGTHIWEILTSIGTVGAVIISLGKIFKQSTPKLDLRNFEFKSATEMENGRISEQLSFDLIPRNAHISNVLCIATVLYENPKDISNYDFKNQLKVTETRQENYIPEGEARRILAFCDGLGNTPKNVAPYIVFKDDKDKCWAYYKGKLKKIRPRLFNDYLKTHYDYLMDFYRRIE
ncbi:hypothetical protein [Corticicoccus populi]|uniref:Uncharacterized protein n=1 Tax=Corticicoccus populi TaxID=1812821 RepID=A0ABW5WWP9_9STAP